MFTKEELNEKIWFDIPGYEGLYQINLDAEVLSLNYERTGKPGLLKPADNGKGYLFVCLTKNKKHKLELVHRLMAITFIPNPDPERLIEVNHIDENPRNNSLDNLEWTTHQRNLNHATARIRTALQHRKEVVKIDADGNKVAVYDSIISASKMNLVHPSCICAALRGRTKTAAGHYWEYTNNPPKTIKRLYQQFAELGDFDGPWYNNDVKIEEVK